MKQVEAMKLLQDTWDAQWPTLRPTAKYAFENESFRGDPPLWALAFVRHTTSRQMTMGPVGSRRFERNGNIYVLLFGEIEKGRGPIDRAVEDVRAIYEGKILRLAGQQLWIAAARSAESSKGGKTSDGTWFQQQVTIDFKYFEIA